MSKTMSPPDGNEDGRHNSDGEANRHQLGEEKNDGTELTVPSAEGRPVDKNEPTPSANDTKKNEDVTPNQGDIFDDLEALGRPLDEVIPSEKVLTSLPMRKPKKDEWVRIHPEIRTRAYLYEVRDENSNYIVLPEVVEPMKDVVRYVQLSLAVTYSGVYFVWPAPIPTEKKAHRAHITAFAAADQAQHEWTRVSWGDGEYDVYRRKSAKNEPVWPEDIKTPSDMLRFAAKAGAIEVIESIEHPVVQALLGLD
ncbi:hypothetical protein OAF99_02795 [Akkermansiaceae bacterium]|nr:hypothetical protein [Akkermansiaceae bacterium]